jgi:putative flippase GtrA
MKRLRRFGRYGALGTVNAVLSYVIFVSLALVVSQLMASIITEICMQLFRYYGLGRFVFTGENARRPTLLAYILAVLPGSLVLFANVAILAHFTPAYITGAISLVVAILYYQILKRLYKAH